MEEYLQYTNIVHY